MQLENDLMQGIKKMGYLNIETSGKEETVKRQIKTLASSKETDEVEKKLIAERKQLLEKTFFVYSISCIMRQDKAKVLNCEICRQPTNTVIKLTKHSKRSCAECFLKEAKAAEDTSKQEKQKGTMKP